MTDRVHEEELKRMSRRPPNIVLSMCDDQRHDYMSCAGHPYLETPAMDRLAHEGVRFSNAFTAVPLCGPSRASHLSGLYPHRHGAIHNKADLADGVRTWPELLQEAGYRTAFIGKIHYGGAQPHRGFDRWVSFEGQGDYDDPILNIDGEEIPHHGYNTDILTDYACRFMQDNADRPWALCLWYKAPHTPFTPPARHRDAYAEVPLTYPSTINASLDGKTHTMRHGKPQGHARDWFPDGPFVREKTWDEVMRDYARSLNGVDDALGRVLDQLDSAGVADDTLVVHTSDHGYFLGEFQLADKRWMYDPSIRVPALVKYPAWTAERGRVQDDLVLSLDIPATIVDAAGLAVPSEYQGQSLKPLLAGDGEWVRDAVFIEYFEDPPFPALPTMVCLRTRSAKLIHYLRAGESDEFYDLARDPEERVNVIDDPAYADAVHDLRTQLDIRLQDRQRAGR